MEKQQENNNNNSEQNQDDILNLLSDSKEKPDNNKKEPQRETKGNYSSDQQETDVKFFHVSGEKDRHSREFICDCGWNLKDLFKDGRSEVKCLICLKWSFIIDDSNENSHEKDTSVKNEKVISQENDEEGGNMVFVKFLSVSEDEKKKQRDLAKFICICGKNLKELFVDGYVRCPDCPCEKFITHDAIQNSHKKYATVKNDNWIRDQNKEKNKNDENEKPQENTCQKKRNSRESIYDRKWRHSMHQKGFLSFEKNEIPKDSFFEKTKEKRKEEEEKIGEKEEKNNNNAADTIDALKISQENEKFYIDLIVSAIMNAEEPWVLHDGRDSFSIYKTQKQAYDMQSLKKDQNLFIIPLSLFEKMYPNAFALKVPLKTEKWVVHDINRNFSLYKDYDTACKMRMLEGDCTLFVIPFSMFDV